MATIARVRSDALPENTDYRDDGCEVSPRCLDCPLPRCRYEDPGGVPGILRELRDESIRQAAGRGTTADDLARTHQVSRRTIFRVLATRERSMG